MKQIILHEDPSDGRQIRITATVRRDGRQRTYHPQGDWPITAIRHLVATHPVEIEIDAQDGIQLVIQSQR